MCPFRFSRRVSCGAIGLGVLWLVCAAGPGAKAQAIPRPAPTPNDTLVSPEVLPDHRVTFRIYAPKATEVAVRGEWAPMRGLVNAGEKMAKSDQGVWSITVGPLAPDIYRYSFNLDGVKVVDPKNPGVTEGMTNPEIGRALYISSDTVKTHLAHIMTKLDLGRRVDLVRWWHRRSGQPSPE